MLYDSVTVSENVALSGGAIDDKTIHMIMSHAGIFFIIFILLFTFTNFLMRDIGEWLSEKMWCSSKRHIKQVVKELEQETKENCPKNNLSEDNSTNENPNNNINT